MKKPNLKRTRIQIDVDVDLLARIKVAASDRRRSVANYSLLAIEDEVCRDENAKKIIPLPSPT